MFSTSGETLVLWTCLIVKRRHMSLMFLLGTTYEFGMRAKNDVRWGDFYYEVFEANAFDVRRVLGVLGERRSARLIEGQYARRLSWRMNVVEGGATFVVDVANLPLTAVLDTSAHTGMVCCIATLRLWSVVARP
jgi:hypothetical protein